MMLLVQLLNEFFNISRYPKVHYRVHKSSPLDPIIRKLNPFLSFTFYIVKNLFNIILSNVRGDENILAKCLPGAPTIYIPIGT